MVQHHPAAIHIDTIPNFDLRRPIRKSTVVNFAGATRMTDGDRTSLTLALRVQTKLTDDSLIGQQRPYSIRSANIFERQPS
jgi:hypothetical protein